MVGKHRRGGGTLLEVVIAVTLLTAGGLAIVASVQEGAAAAARMRDREHDLRAASRFLEAAVLWPRSDLELRLGMRPQGTWLLRVTRPAATFYELVLLDTVGRELLRTGVHRPPETDTLGAVDATR